MTNSARQRARAALKTALLAPLRAIDGHPLAPCGSVPPWSVAAWSCASDSDEIFWLSCVYDADRPNTKYSFATQLETAALFALVARVELSLWKELVRDVWGEDWNWIEWTDFVATRTALFAGVEVLVSGDQVGLVTISETVVAWLRGPRSDKYLRVRALIAEASGMASAELPVVPLRLTVDDDVDLLMELPRHLKRVCDVLATHPQESTPVLLTHFTSGTRDVTVEVGDIGALAALRGLGIHVTDLPVAGIRSGVQLTRPQCLEYVCEMLAVTPSPPSSPVYTQVSRTRRQQLSTKPPLLAGLERIALSSSLPDELVPAVFSAIRTSSSLRAVEFEIGEASRQRASVLQWLAFATLCRDPLAQVTISQSSKLRMRDVEIMRQIVTAKNPLAVLFPEEIVPDESRVVVTSSAFLSHPRTTANPIKWSQETPASLEIIGAAHKGFVPVLLPGWGKAWVSEAAALKTPGSNNPINGRVLHSPVQLVIHNGAVTPALLAFIRLFGTSVKWVKMYEFDNQDTALDRFCRQLMISCPQLEELEVRNVWFGSLQFIVDAFEANECPALTKLKLLCISLGCTRGINATMHALSDPNTAMARQLKQLEFFVNMVSSIEPATPERTREMLERNSTLRAFMLKFAPDAYPEECEVDFTPFHKTELLHDPMPLSRRSLCAFLSAISRSHKTLKQLDSVLVRHILGYAGARRVRTVQIAFDPFNALRRPRY